MTAAGASRLVLTATVARLYYLEDASEAEIAQDYGLSHAQVTQLLEEARSTGLVRISVDP